MHQIQVNEHSAKAESALNKFFSLSLDLFCITEENGYFQQLSPAWETVLGWTVSELLRTPWIELVHPDDVEVTLNIEQQGFLQNCVEYENRYRHHDGSYRWLSWRVLPDQDGLVYKVAKDITATKHSEEALRDRLERETLKRQQTELDLRNSERRFRAVFNQTFQFSSLLQLDGTVWEDNQTALDFCQLKRQDIVGRPFWDMRCWAISSETQAQLKRAIAQAAAGNVIRYEVDILAPDDSIVTIDFSLKPLLDESGQVELLIAEGRDLTEHKRIETALIKSEERFRCLTACSPVGIFLADVEGRCTYANPRLVSLLGLTLEEMLGKGWAQAVHPGDREWVFTEWSECAVQGYECYQEYRFQTPQGMVRWVQARTSPMRSEQGELLGHVGTVEDITERKQAEEALRLSEKRYALAVSAGKIGVWDWNLETNEIYVEPSLKAMLGYEDNEIPNQIEVWGECVHPDDRERVMALANAHLEGMTPQYEVEHRMLHKDGSIRWFLACGTAIRDTHGKAIRMMGTDSDITERKQAEAELRKAYQQLALHVDNSPLAILEWDNEFRLQRWSKQAERIFGWKATELLHKHPWDWGFIYPEDAQVVDNILRRLLDGAIEYTVDENRNYTKDGRIVHCQWYNSVLLDESGNLLSILSLVLDITERKQAEAALQQVLSELETRVEERTAQLQQANEQLSAEIAERQRTEAALRQSEEQFRRVFDEAPIGMALTGKDKRFLRVNQALVEMLGYSKSEFTNLTCEAITHPEDWKRVIPYLEQIARGEIDRFQIEERFLKQNQEILWGNLTSMVLRDESGEILYGLGMVEDITERRQAEEGLRQSEEQFRRVFDEAPIGMSLADLDNRYIRVNRTFYEILGYTESELMALTFEDITYPADLEQENPCMAQLLNGEIDSFSLEKRYLTKNQEIVWVNLTLIALRDHAGVILYTLAMIEDITERKHAEEALRQSEARYRAIIEDQTELICRFQPDGTLTFVNDAYCRYFNKRESELMGHNFMPVISEEDREFVAQKFGSLSVEQPIVTYEYRVILPSGETRWQQWTDRALFDDSGSLLEFQAVGRDITTLKQAEAEILKALERERELSELRSGFVSLVSHEFRTPLTAIQSSAELLERYKHKLSDEKKQNHHRRIQNAVQRMTQLLEDVLTIGKAEAGKLKFTPSPMDLVAFCHDLVESLQISAKPQHKINFVAVGDGSDAQMDEKLLAHILTNLLSNAIKYSPDGGMVQFDLICNRLWRCPLGGATSDRSWAIFRIQDSGIGIPPEDVEHLFESFGRASNVGAIPGTGLGLAIVKKCVDLHGGQITVESEIGAGTTFTVTLPLKSLSDTMSQEVNDN
jgi:PAS domain S-box-containing protein